MPTARVGGPDVAGSGGRFQKDFLRHCLEGTNWATGQKGTPLDLVSFHAKGAPEFVDGHVRMGIAEHLRTIGEGFQIVSSFPARQGRPIEKKSLPPNLSVPGQERSFDLFSLARPFRFFFFNAGPAALF